MKKSIGIFFVACMCFALCSCQIYKQAFDQAGEIFVSSNEQAHDIIVSAQDQANNIASSIYDSLQNPSSASLTANSAELTETNTAETTTETTTHSIEDTIKSEFEACKRKPLGEIVKIIDKYEYSATYLAQGVDFTEFIDMLVDDYLTEDFTIDHRNKSIEVDVVLAANVLREEQESALKEKLEVSYAWFAAEEYGEKLYGSFELHYITGKLAEELDDENTWFLKASCTVLGVDKMCEAKVTGTTAAPQVISFIVY